MRTSSFYWHARRLLLVFVFLVELLTPAYAAESDRQGQIEFQRQREAEQRLRDRLETMPQVSLDRLLRPEELANAKLMPEPRCFAVQELQLEIQPLKYAYRFSGLVNAAEKTRDGEYDSYRGRCVGAQGINILMRRIQNMLIENGYITARVGAPEQDLSGGVLRLSVTLGTVAAVRRSPTSSLSPALANAIPLSPGEVLNVRDLEQALENFKRLSSVEADIQIVPAEAALASDGQSDLVIDLRQHVPVHAMATADNSGTRATGRYQSGLTLSIDNPLGLNDLLYLNYNRGVANGSRQDKDTEGKSAHYSIPVDYWLLSTNFSRSGYRQRVLGATENYLYRGESETAELKAAWLFHRARNSKTSVWGALWRRESHNFYDETEIAVQQRQVAGSELGLRHQHNWEQVSLDAGMSYKHGLRILGSMPAPEEGFGEGSAIPRLYSYDLKLSYHFSAWQHQFKWVNQLRGQSNSNVLTPQDRFYIGGRSTVRAYDNEHMLAGERGSSWRTEFSYLIGTNETYLGFDYAEVRGEAARYLPTRHLAGAAVGLRGNWQGVGYEVFWAVPIKSNEHSHAPGHVLGFNIGIELGR